MLWVITCLFMIYICILQIIKHTFSTNVSFDPSNFWNTASSVAGFIFTRFVWTFTVIFLFLQTSQSASAYFLTPNITGKAVLYITFILSRTFCFKKINMSIIYVQYNIHSEI